MIVCRVFHSKICNTHIGLEQDAVLMPKVSSSFYVVQLVAWHSSLLAFAGSCDSRRISKTVYPHTTQSLLSKLVRENIPLKSFHLPSSKPRSPQPWALTSLRTRRLLRLERRSRAARSVRRPKQQQPRLCPPPRRRLLSLEPTVLTRQAKPMAGMRMPMSRSFRSEWLTQAHVA